MSKRMHKQSYFLVFVILLFAFSLSACDYEPSSHDPSSSKYFAWDLREIWESETRSIYQGEIEITYNTIKITGYYEDQTPPPLFGGNDNERPFRTIPKGTALKGYSEDGKIFIEGYASGGIPYDLQKVGAYPYTKILSFEFSGRTEILHIR